MAKNVLILDDTMTAIGDAIRALNGTEAKMRPRDMPDAIKAGGGGDLKAMIERSADRITIPDNVTKIGSYAFANWDTLNYVKIGKNVTEIGYKAFEACSSLYYVWIPKSVKNIGISAFEISGTNARRMALYEGTYDSWQDVDVGGNNTSLSPTRYNCVDNGDGTVIGTWRTSGGLFGNNNLVAYIGTDANVTIGPTGANGKPWEGISGEAFNRCNVETVTFDDEGRRAIFSEIQAYAFDHCQQLTTVRFNLTDAPNKIATNAFETCNALTDIYVSWAEGAVSGAPWGATSANIHYNGEE